MPWLLGWDYYRLDDESRKCFEVALHAGTAAALLIARREEAGDATAPVSVRRLARVGLSLAPAALAGYALEGTIERHLGTPPTIAAGLASGAVAMALADRAPQTRSARDARPADAIWLGVAQACALYRGSRAAVRPLPPPAYGDSREPARAVSRAAGPSR